MTIKPLEKKAIKGLIPKLIFLLILLIGGLLINVFVSRRVQRVNAEQEKPSVLGTEKNAINPARIINDTVKNMGNTSSQILGETTQIVSSTASKSADAVSKFIFDNTIGKIIDQVKILPKDQQEKIKQEICK